MKAYKVLKGYFQSLPEEKVCFQQPNVALGTLLNLFCLFIVGFVTS